MLVAPAAADDVSELADEVIEELGLWPLLADFVAKLFLALRRAIMIQDQTDARNVDSKTYPLRFDCC